MKKFIFTLVIGLTFCLAADSQTVMVYVDNQTSCDYQLGLDNICAKSLLSGPLDVPAYTNVNGALNSFGSGLNVSTDIEEMYIYENGSTDSDNIFLCNTSPIYISNRVYCDALPIKVNWWISGGDFYIEITT